MKLIDKDGFNYTFLLEDGENKSLMLEFLDVEEPNIGDTVIFKDELLDKKYEEYSDFYTFGDMGSKYGRANLDVDDIDVIKVISKDKEILLKRLYG